MEESGKRKKSTFEFKKTPRQIFTRNLVRRQPTLVGSYLNLMENQKIVIAIIKVKKEDQSIIMIPIIFKVDEGNIPSDLCLNEVSSNNLVFIDLKGFKSIAAMIVSVGDDSRELIKSYSQFCEKNKDKIRAFESKVHDWIRVENVKISRFSAAKLPSMRASDLEHVINGLSTSNSFEKNKVPATSTISKKVDVVELDSNDNSNSGDEKNKDQTVQTEPEITADLKKLKAHSAKLFGQPHIHPALETIIKILESLIFSKGLQDVYKTSSTDESNKNPYEEVRLIPDKDRTFIAGEITMVEGILPLKSNKYKAAISKGSSKSNEPDYEPNTILTNIVRFAFPKHWLVNVTLKGSGGRKSLLNIWNFKNPLANPCEGDFENGLGEQRLRALIDHVVRKGKKSSYDRSTEKFLMSNLAKAMHSVRLRFKEEKDKNEKRSSHGLLDLSYCDDDEDDIPMNQEKLLEKNCLEDSAESEILHNSLEKILTSVQTTLTEVDTSGQNNEQDNEEPHEDNERDDEQPPDEVNVESENIQAPDQDDPVEKNSGEQDENSTSDQSQNTNQSDSDQEEDSNHDLSSRSQRVGNQSKVDSGVFLSSSVLDNEDSLLNTPPLISSTPSSSKRKNEKGILQGGKKSKADQSEAPKGLPIKPIRFFALNEDLDEDQVPQCLNESERAEFIKLPPGDRNLLAQLSDKFTLKAALAARRNNKDE